MRYRGRAVCFTLLQHIQMRCVAQQVANTDDVSARIDFGEGSVVATRYPGTLECGQRRCTEASVKRTLEVRRATPGT